MARTATLAEMRNQARQRADMVNSQFCSDSEINEYVNQSIAELYDILVSKFEHYYIASSNITVVANTDTYNLPAAMYKVLGLDLDSTTSFVNPVTLKPFMFSERNRYSYVNSVLHGNLANLRYILQGTQVRVIPPPSMSGVIRVWYIPHQTKLVLDADTFDGINGWEEYVVIDVAMKMKIKEETPIDGLMAQKQIITGRIEAMAANRDATEPSRISDVYLTNEGVSNLLDDYWAL